MSDPWGEKPIPDKFDQVFLKGDDAYWAKEMDEFLDKLHLYEGNLHQDIADLKETIKNMEEQERAYIRCIDHLKEINHGLIWNKDLRRIGVFDPCPFCRMGFLYPHEPHQRLHGVKGYACDNCGRVFQDSDGSETA